MKDKHIHLRVAEIEKKMLEFQAKREGMSLSRFILTKCAMPDDSKLFEEFAITLTNKKNDYSH